MQGYHAPMALKDIVPDDPYWKAVKLQRAGEPIEEIARKVDVPLPRLRDYLTTWGHTKYARTKLLFEIAQKGD